MGKFFELKPGYELRGMRIRLYPDKETEEKLKLIEDDTRRAWNWLVKQTEDVIQARQAYALRHGLVPAKPQAPDYNGLSPEEAKATKERFIADMRGWHSQVHKATNKVPECGYRSFKELLVHFGDKYGYQLLSRVVSWYHEVDEEKAKVEPQAHTLQALVENFFTKAEGMRRKKFRRPNDPMPLQTRSRDCFEMGSFGARRGNPFYDCQVKFNGLRIRGRMPGKKPEGRVLEGVSICKEADGWWAAIKQEVPIRALPDVMPNTVVGIDVGLDYIATISEVRAVANTNAQHYGDVGPELDPPRRVSNTRNKAYVERIAGRQAMKKPVGRLQLAAARHIKHTIYNEIIKPLASIETIKIEKLSSKIGQMGSSKTSVMRTIAGLLVQRYGTRVREVEPHYTSQDCSQCQFRSKETWSYEHGRMGECPQCNYRADRDLNAARNVAFKPMISLAS